MFIPPMSHAVLIDTNMIDSVTPKLLSHWNDLGIATYTTQQCSSEFQRFIDVERQRRVTRDGISRKGEYRAFHYAKEELLEKKKRINFIQSWEKRDEFQSKLSPFLFEVVDLAFTHGYVMLPLKNYKKAVRGKINGIERNLGHLYSEYGLQTRFKKFSIGMGFKGLLPSIGYVPDAISDGKLTLYKKNMRCQVYRRNITLSFDKNFGRSVYVCPTTFADALHHYEEKVKRHLNKRVVKGSLLLDHLKKSGHILESPKSLSYFGLEQMTSKIIAGEVFEKKMAYRQGIELGTFRIRKLRAGKLLSNSSFMKWYSVNLKKEIHTAQQNGAKNCSFDADLELIELAHNYLDSKKVTILTRDKDVQEMNAVVSAMRGNRSLTTTPDLETIIA